VVVIVKLVAATRAEMVGGAVAGVTLQVTDSFVPKLESSCKNIWLLAVTDVVLTVTVVPDAATTTLPADEEPQTAGAADDEQLLALDCVADDKFPGKVNPVAFSVPTTFVDAVPPTMNVITFPAVAVPTAKFPPALADPPMTNKYPSP
jgi:hypothetical protein